MSARTWKIGDWAELHRVRYLVYAVHSDFVYGVRLSGSAQWARDKATHLPDCTGWDWQPIEPIELPEGYRFLTDAETIQHGDLFFQNEEWNKTDLHGESVGESLAWYGRLGIKAYARKIEPQYRPFANAAEFAPHRDKWIKAKISLYAPGYAAKIDAYCDRGVYSVTGKTARLESWKYAFDNLLFEDGTPFGIATTEKESTCAK